MSKIILITGATDGIGRLTAEKFVSLGYQVLLHGRDAEKLSRFSQDLGGVPTYQADFSDLDEVAEMARTVLSEQDHLDCLINNAGILKTAHTRTKAGRDIRFDVNMIAPYLLTKLLLPLIPKEGRIINLSSAAQAPLDIKAMQNHQPMPDMAAYAQSKCGLTIWSAALARQMPQGPLSVAVNPGSLLATKMVKEGFGIEGHDVTIGADILIEAANSSRFAEASGAYFDNDAGEFAPLHDAALDAAHCQEVMAALKAITAAYLGQR